MRLHIQNWYETSTIPLRKYIQRKIEKYTKEPGMGGDSDTLERWGPTYEDILTTPNRDDIFTKLKSLHGPGIILWRSMVHTAFQSAVLDVWEQKSSRYTYNRTILNDIAEETERLYKREEDIF